MCGVEIGGTNEPDHGGNLAMGIFKKIRLDSGRGPCTNVNFSVDRTKDEGEERKILRWVMQGAYMYHTCPERPDGINYGILTCVD